MHTLHIHTTGGQSPLSVVPAKGDKRGVELYELRTTSNPLLSASSVVGGVCVRFHTKVTGLDIADQRGSSKFGDPDPSISGSVVLVFLRPGVAGFDATPYTTARPEVNPRFHTLGPQTRDYKSSAGWRCYSTRVVMNGLCPGAVCLSGCSPASGAI